MAGPNPFDEFDPDVPKTRAPNPFDEFDPSPDDRIVGFDYRREQAQTSATGAFGRGFGRSLVPSIGAMPAIGAGAEAGAWAGAPFAPFTGGWSIPIGGVIGGVGAGFGGSYAISKAQDWLLSKLPDSWVEKLGMSERQQELDQKYHGTASFMGGLAPYAITMKPGGASRAALPENATTLQRIMAHPATSRVFSGAVMGGIELGQELVHGEAPDWTHVALATGFGVVFNRPNRIGETLEKFGGQPFRWVRGLPEPTAAAPAQAPEQTGAAPARPASEAAAAEAPPSNVVPLRPDLNAAEARAELLNRNRQGEPLKTAEEIVAGANAGRGPRRYPVTLADAADMGVMGPGITEDTFQGSHQRSPEAEQSAREHKQTEISVIGRAVEAPPDVDAAARRMHPEMFAEWDRLQAQRAELARWIDETNHPSDATIAEATERRDALQRQHDALVESQHGYTGGPEARRLRAEARAAQAEIDMLNERRLAFAEGRASQTEDLIQARQHLLDTDYALQDMRQHVMSAYRNSAERLGAEVVRHEPAEVAPAVEPPAAAPVAPEAPAAEAVPPPAPTAETHPAAPEAPRVLSIEEQRQNIVADVIRRAVAAGVSRQVAEIEGAVVAARYALRASLFPDTGGPQALYRRESAEILRYRQSASGAPPRRPRRFANPSLLPFLARSGGISPSDAQIGDVRAIFGGKNPMTAAGPLIQNGGMTLDRARELAASEGYIFEEGRGGTENRGGGTSTIKTLLDAINDESRGSKRYQPGMEPTPEIDRDHEEHLREQEERELTQKGEGERELFQADHAGINDEVEKLKRLAFNTTQEEIKRWIEGQRPKTLSGMVIRDVVARHEDGSVGYRGWIGGREGFLESEPLWGRARQLAEQQKVSLEAAYTHIANKVFEVLDEPQITVREALEEIARQETAALMRRIAPNRELFQRQRPTEPSAMHDIPGIHLGPGFLSPSEFYQIKAFHASPHDFDKFDITKIGTGQGAQSYGHGIYAAESEAVSGRGGTYDKEFTGKLRRDLPRVEGQAAQFLNMAKGDREAAAQEALAVAANWDRNPAPEARAVADDYRKSAELIQKGWEPPKAKIYQVSINADPAHFLDWDKPLSEQSEHVLQILRRDHPELFEEQWLGAINEPRGKSLLTSSLTREQLERAGWRQGIPAEHMTGDELRRWIGDTDQEATEKLRAAGIPGIRYLDQGSRAAGEGSRNYVIFDDKLIEITHKDGTPVTGKDRDDIVNELSQRQAGKFRDKTAEQIAAGERPEIRLNPSHMDATTLGHEFGHQFLFELDRDAARMDAPQWLKDDFEEALKWTGAGSRDVLFGTTPKGGWTADARKAHEKWARGFEAWRMEGRAPTAALARVFKMFADFLRGIYRNLVGLEQESGQRIDLTDRMRDVYGHLFTTPDELTWIGPEREAPHNMANVHEEDAAKAHPEHAEPVEERLDSERRERQTRSPHEPEIERTAPGPTEPGREDGGQAGAASEIQPGGQPSEPQPGSSGVRAGNGPQLSGVNPPAPQGARVAGRSAAAERPAGEPGGDRTGLDDNPLAPGPADSLDRRESFNVGKNGNIRTENITSYEQFQKAIEDAKERIGGTDEPMTDGQVMDAAQEMGFTPDELTLDKLVRAFGGVKDLNKKVLAFRMAVRDQAERVGDLMRRIQDEGESDDLVAEYAKERTRFDMFMSILSSVTTEWGRAGRSFRNLDGWDEVLKQNLLSGIKQFTGRDLYQLKMEARLGAKLDTAAKVAKYLRDAQKRSFGGMMLEYFVNNLISGPATHMTYYLGNKITRQLETVVEVPLAAAIGALRAGMGRPGERVLAGEALARERAILGGVAKRWQAGIEGLRSGRPTLLPGQEAIPQIPFFGDVSLNLAKNITNDPVSFHEVVGDLFGLMKGVKDGVVSAASLGTIGAQPGAPTVGLHWTPGGQIPDVAMHGVPVLPVGSLVRFPGRVVGLIHSMDVTSNYQASIAARAYREATIDKGLTGRARDSYIASRVANPPQEWMEAAHNEAYAGALMAPGGNFVKRLSALVNTSANIPGIGAIRPLKFIDPFVHIGANVINKAIVERTPLGILSETVRNDLLGKNGNVAQDTAQARMLAGTALSIAFGSLAMEGYITGSGPADHNQNAAWREVYQPHSVRIGDFWYQMNRLGPMGMLMGIAADMYDVARDASEGEMLTAAMHLQHAITQNILDESFMRGPSELIRAVDDPGRYGESYLKSFASSFVPFSVGQFQMNRAMDPYTRNARDVMDAINQRILTRSTMLQPRINVWGEEIPNPDAFPSRGLSAIYEKHVNEDPVRQAMLDLGVAPAPVPKQIRNVDLTPEEYTDFARLAGRLAKQRLNVIVNSPDWRTWGNPIRHNVVVEVVKQSREAARGFMMAKYPHIVRDAVDELHERKMGEPEAIH